MLINMEYEPSVPKEKTIYCKSSKKWRTVSIPCFFPDLCVQWAVIQVIRPILLKGAYRYSCGSAPGKGNDYARKAVEKWIRQDRRNTKYGAYIDIHKFYDNAQLGILKNMLSRKIKDYNCLTILFRIIDIRDIGFPTGYLTSTLFADFMLQELDHKVKEEFGGATYYIRNVDDIFFFGPNKKKLHKLRIEITEYLKSIGLEINDNWQVFKYGKNRVADFVGYRFYRDHTKVRKSISLNIKRKVAKILKKGYATPHMALSLMSNLGWTKHADCYNFYIKNVKNKINLNYIKGVISDESRKRSLEIRKLYQTIYRRCSYIS